MMHDPQDQALRTTGLRHDDGRSAGKVFVRKFVRKKRKVTTAERKLLRRGPLTTTLVRTDYQSGKWTPGDVTRI